MCRCGVGKKRRTLTVCTYLYYQALSPAQQETFKQIKTYDIYLLSFCQNVVGSSFNQSQYSFAALITELCCDWLNLGIFVAQSYDHATI